MYTRNKSSCQSSRRIHHGNECFKNIIIKMSFQDGLSAHREFNKYVAIPISHKQAREPGLDTVFHTRPEFKLAMTLLPSDQIHSNTLVRGVISPPISGSSVLMDKSTFFYALFRIPEPDSCFQAPSQPPSTCHVDSHATAVGLGVLLSFFTRANLNEFSISHYYYLLKSIAKRLGAIKGVKSR